MQTKSATSLFLLLFSCPFLCSGQSAEIKDIIDVTKTAIFSAALELNKTNLPKLKEVELSLEIAIEKEENGQLKIWVISGEAKKTNTNTQKVTINLKPNFDADIDIGNRTLGDDLKNLILETSKSIASVKDGKMSMEVKKG